MFRKGKLNAYQILRNDDCQLIRDKIFNYRKNWSDRSSLKPGCFYTLGYASYLDKNFFNNLNEEKDKKLKASNFLIMNEFYDLLKLVADSIKKITNEDVLFTSSFALPGFHIFLEKALFKGESSAGAHFDLQGKTLPWNFDVSSIDTLSFTLPISLPYEGTGLDYWNLSFHDFETGRLAQKYSDTGDFIKQNKCNHHPYKRGHLLLHSGNILHRIGGTHRTYANDERITLQGHGIKVDNTWILYW